MLMPVIPGFFAAQMFVFLICAVLRRVFLTDGIKARQTFLMLELFDL